MPNVGHWASAEPFFGIAGSSTQTRADLTPGWVQGEDRLRVAAYDLYEAIYWTAPDAFQLTMRGQEGQPIYIPSGRKIVDTAHRYMAPGLQVVEDPTFGSDAERSDAHGFMTDFAARERFYSKFSAAKLRGIMRGDWLFHIMADEARPAGTKVSLVTVHPSTYFPVFAADDPDSIIAVKIADAGLDDRGQPIVNVLEYRKQNENGGPSPIDVSYIQFDGDNWGQPGTDMGEKTIKEITPAFTLPDPIDAIPVYHMPNVYDTEFAWGSSEMRGIERLMRGINQAITDEELALVLEGLGVYTTTAGAPIDEDGDELPWTIAPGRVIELPQESVFGRVTGVNTVTPYMDHLRYLHSQLEESVGNNDVTSGRVDVAVAESGIALALRMGPLLSRMAEKELVVTDVTTQMLFDMRKWFGAFEGLNFDNVRWMPTYSEKLPINQNDVFKRVLEMYTAVPPLITASEARRMLSDSGISFDPNMTDAQIAAEQGAYAAAQADAVAVRISQGATGP